MVRLPLLRRRALLLAAAWQAGGGTAWALDAGRPLRFDEDFGAHPETQTEWWYATGHGRAGSRELGFQITFFRSRVAATQALTSRFAARQLVAAHAAITDLQAGKLLHDQRLARSSGDAAFDNAIAETGNTRLRLGSWSLLRETTPSPVRYAAKADSADFALDLTLTPQQPVLLQGQQGWSRKGPDAAQVSGYYSEPQLQVTGSISLQGQALPLSGGAAWLDHEWSDSLLPPGAVGWDWLGINLFDGSALTAFRLRDKDGAALWDGGSFRGAKGAGGQQTYIFSRGETDFHVRRHWTSPRTGARYPVEWALRTPADFYTLRALLDDQELDSRASTGAVYWEGLSELLDSQGRVVGRGYLEMTGYAKPLRL
jgi:predicted secreted hydrolase